MQQETDGLALAVPEIWFGPKKIKTGHVTVTTPLWVVIFRP